MVVPLLHRNTISFMAMQRRQQYIAHNHIKDRFIALDKDNFLTTWSICTGQIIGTPQKVEVDYSGYELYCSDDEDYTYKREWFEITLLKSIEPVMNMSDADFYKDWQTKSQFENQMSFVSKTKKDFHRFKAIQIIGEKGVEEVFSFVHPYYGQYQLLIFSDDFEYMLEILVNNRYHFYKR